MMIKATLLSACLAFGAAGAARAAFLPVPAGMADSTVVRVAEGCGPGFWRGPGGHCNPFNPYRYRRDPRFACPLGFHIGPAGGRCWPNR